MSSRIENAWYSFSPLFIIGHRLDTLARMALWEVGLDYLHGTGHGIGSFLNVHEGTSHSCVCVLGCERVKVCKKAYLVIDFFGCAFCINFCDFWLSSCFKTWKSIIGQQPAERHPSMSDGAVSFTERFDVWSIRSYIRFWCCIDKLIDWFKNSPHLSSNQN